MNLLNGKPNGDFKCKEVILQCSNDNTNWIGASEVITLSNAQNNQYIVNTKVNEPYPQWRLFIKSADNARYASITEMKFYE